MSELREIRNAAIVNMKELVQQYGEEIKEAYRLVMRLEHVTRSQGLLALEEEACYIPRELPLCDRVTELLELIVDGTEPEMIEEMAILQFMTQEYHGIEAVLYYIYARSMLLIQEGVSPYVIEMFFDALLPEKELLLEERQKRQGGKEEQKLQELKEDLSKAEKRCLEEIQEQLCCLTEEEWQDIVGKKTFYGFAKLLPFFDEETQDLVAKHMNKYRYQLIMNNPKVVLEEEFIQMNEDLKELIARIREKADYTDLLGGITKWSDWEIRKFLWELDKAGGDTLALALKGAKEEVKEHFFCNLSVRMRYMLKEEMDALGPVRWCDVEDAQRRVLKIAKEKMGWEFKE